MTKMEDSTIKEAFQENGYIVAEDIIDDGDLEPIRSFIKEKVDEYAHEKHAQGRLASLHDEASFGRRYAAICKELDISPRNWAFGSFGRLFYDLFNQPGIINVVRALLGPEVSNDGIPVIRTKLPGSLITSFPWHQDSQYFDQKKIGQQEKRTEHLTMVTVWVPLIDATVENGCCWVIPGSHHWGLLDGSRGEDKNVRMDEDIEARGVDPVPIPLKPGGALFMSNLCAHTSKVNQTNECRWSVDFRYFPTPDRADLTPAQRSAADFAQTKLLKDGSVPLSVLSRNTKTTWEQWEAAVLDHSVKEDN